MTTIIRLTRGLIDDLLQKDGLNTYIFTGIHKRFQITEPFVVESTIQIFKNGISLGSSHWTYDADTNFVTIDVLSGETLDPDDAIEIKYHYYKKYSDEGLAQVIESSLAKFTEHNYKKMFSVEDGELCTINGITPTHPDKQLISLVAAIIAEPNITVNTPDFSFRPNDTRSESEKISTIFRSVNKASGIIEFIDGDC